jgi:hypothetical protein
MNCVLSENPANLKCMPSSVQFRSLCWGLIWEKPPLSTSNSNVASVGTIASITAYLFRENDHIRRIYIIPESKMLDEWFIDHPLQRNRNWKPCNGAASGNFTSL